MRLSLPNAQAHRQDFHQGFPRWRSMTANTRRTRIVPNVAREGRTKVIPIRERTQRTRTSVPQVFSESHPCAADDDPQFPITQSLQVPLMSNRNPVDTSATNTPEPSEDILLIGAGIDFADPNSPLARYYLRPVHVAAVAVLGLVFLLLNHVPLWHTDIWAGGRRSVDGGARHFARWQSVLSIRGPGCAALHYDWLSQCFFPLIFQVGAALAGGDGSRQLAGGVDALRFTHALLVLLPWWFCWRRSGASADRCPGLGHGGSGHSAKRRQHGCAAAPGGWGTVLCLCVFRAE